MTEKQSIIDRMRPKDLQKNVEQLRKLCGKNFYKENKKSFVEVACPACGKLGKDLFIKYGFQHKKCLSCLTMWCSPRPNESLLLEYYATSESTKLWTTLLINTNIDRKLLQYEPRIVSLLNILGKDSNFSPLIAADLGAGSGAFALSLKRSNYFSNVIAVDFEKNCCNVCESLGLDTINGSIESLENDSVSLLTMNDMIEHLFDPMKFLESCYEKLNKNGYISIACPNGEGFDFKIMEKKTVNIVPPEHLNYFNPSSLELLLARVGFKVISVETPGILDIDIVKREYELGNIDLSNNDFIKNLIKNGSKECLNRFQDFLQNTKQSSHMVVIAKKD